MPSGITPATISVERKLPNSSTRIARMPNIATMHGGADAAEALLRGLDLAAEHER